MEATKGDTKKLLYEHVKAYIESELGIRKETVGSMIEKISERVINKKLDQFFVSLGFIKSVNAQISKALTDPNSYNFDGLTPEAKRVIRKNVNDFLMKEIKDKIKINSISVLVE